MLILFVILLVVFVFLVLSFYLTNIAFYPKTYDYDLSYSKEIEKKYFEKEFFDNLVKDEFYIEVSKDCKLHCIYIDNKNSEKTAIFSHGFSYTLFGSVKYIDMFLKKGYNIIIYDHRFHGKSSGKHCTMGYKEKDDLKKVVDWLFQKNPKNSITITHGESMGGATVLLHGSVDNRISGIIADCPFESVWAQFKYRLKIDYKLPTFPILYIANFISKFRIGIKFSKISPIKTIEKINCPILFIHGEKDSYIPKENSINMYKKKEENNFLYIAKDSDHAESYIKNKEIYYSFIENFIDFIENKNLKV